MLHLCPIQSGFDIISTHLCVVNGFLSILQRKTLAFFLPVGKPDLLRFLRRRPAPQPGTLRWGNFLTGQKVTKDPPKAGPSPALWNPPRGTGCPCVLFFSALGPVGSHRWYVTSTESTCFSGRQCFYRQCLTLVCNCSQLPVVWLPAAGTPLLQGRPGGGNRLAIGPAAQGRLVWWHKQGPQQG